MEKENKNVTMEWLVKRLRDVDTERGKLLERCAELESNNVICHAKLDAIKAFLDDDTLNNLGEKRNSNGAIFGIGDIF